MRSNENLVSVALRDSFETGEQCNKFKFKFKFKSEKDEFVRDMAFDVRFLLALIGGCGCVLSLGKWLFVHSLSITACLFV